MWLLSTDRAVLHSFAAPETAIGGYAVLSHTWENAEQSFQEIRDIEAQCKKDGTNPRDFVSDKIRNCCILAESHGYRWVWIDACCIDKTSSTELSEAINSMFQWYSQAEVCYAFLVDVPRDCGPLDASDSAFRTSRWHTRGWTLQELIAPATVIFISSGWTHLGSREDPTVAHLLEDITGIPWEVFTRASHFYNYNIAVRMSWASKRSTTRVEDEAYCLMGLFEVNMPTIYGEGRRAFQRLQHEIMRSSSDASLFVWGNRMNDETFEAQDLRASPDRFVNTLNDINYLFARAPHHFRSGVYFTPTVNDPIQKYPPDQDGENNAEQGPTGPFDRVELPRFSTTSYGIKCRFPMIEADGYKIAVLLCETQSDHLGLLLQEDTSGQDPTRPRYYTSAPFYDSDESSSTVFMRRTVSLGSDLYNLRFNGKVVKAAWRTFYIVPSAVQWASPNAGFSRLHLNYNENNAFRIPHWLIATFTAIGFQTKQVTDDSSANRHRVRFGDPWRGEWIYIDLGFCSRASEAESEPQPEPEQLEPEQLEPEQSKPESESEPEPASASASASASAPESEPQPKPKPRRLAPWAKVFPTEEPQGEDSETLHDCSEDHIDAWPDRAKAFGDSERTVRISFAPCGVNPQSTLIVHLELLGEAYKKMLRSANVSIPTREALPIVKAVTAPVGLQASPLPSSGAVLPRSSSSPGAVMARFMQMFGVPRYLSALPGRSEHERGQDGDGLATATSYLDEDGSRAFASLHVSDTTIPGAFPEH